MYFQANVTMPTNKTRGTISVSDVPEEEFCLKCWEIVSETDKSGISWRLVSQKMCLINSNWRQGELTDETKKCLWFCDQGLPTAKDTKPLSEDYRSENNCIC